MNTISVGEIEQNFSSYLQRVQAGEVFVITDHGTPVAEIMPVATLIDGIRPFALCHGDFQVAEGFDDPLPDDLLRDFGSL
jgi:prevent-host-death family protein